MPDVDKSALLLRLSAPMQAWGSGSLFEIRDTQSEPTKSGVTGLLGCACGRRREDLEFIAKCCELSMGVLVIKEGKRLWDYHVSGGGNWINGRTYGVAAANGKNTGSPVLSRRCYLSDADFVVALIGNTGFINELGEGLKKPVWPVYLGRKAFPPSTPVFLAKTTDTEVKKALLHGLLKVMQNEDWLHAQNNVSPSGKEFKCPNWVSILSDKTKANSENLNTTSLRMVLECLKDEGNSIEDVPLSFEKLHRRYSRRYIKNDYLSTTAIVEEIHAGFDLPDKA